MQNRQAHRQANRNNRRNSKIRVEPTKRKSGNLKAGIALIACVVLAVTLAVWKVSAAGIAPHHAVAPVVSQPAPVHLAVAQTPQPAPASNTGGDWILAPDHPPVPETIGDIPRLPMPRTSHDPGFHAVQVQKRAVDGNAIVLTCFNPATRKTELVVGKVGRDTVFTLGNPTGALRTGAIQNVQKGDYVPTRNPETGKTEFKRVAQTYKHLAHETVTAQFADKTGKVVQTLTATPEHPFFVPGRGAVPLGQLGIGTQVVTRAGPPLVLASLVRHEYPRGIAVYNFEVEGDHTYFVGKANGGAWVHNTCVPENTNPFKGPVGERVFNVDPHGNAIPVEPGESLTGSPDGRWLQVRDAEGNPTGMRIDGPHNPLGHPDPRAQVPHAHVPGVTNSDGTPWLPINY